MNPYGQLFQAASAKYGVPVGLLQAVAQNESGFNPQASSNVGAQGIMQVMPQNDAALGISNPYDPAQNIYGAARLLAQNLKATGGNVGRAVLMYHGGPNPANWGPKTQAYQKKVMQTYAQNATPSLADWNAALGGGTTAPKQQANSNQTPSLADWNAALADNTPPAEQPGKLASFGRGVEQGAHDVLDWPAEKLAQGASALGIPQALQKMGIDIPTGAQTQAADTAYRNQFNTGYKGNTSAQIGRVGGQLLASVPMLELGGAGIRGLTGVAGDALGGEAGNLVRGAGNFLTGRAGAGVAGIPGIGARLASSTAGGGLYGAGAGALTSPAYGDSFADQVKRGAEAGAVGGALLPVINGVVVRPLSNMARTLVSPLIDSSPKATNRAAVNALTKALQADKMTPEQALERMRWLGPEATLADAGGPNVSTAAQSVAATPGPGQVLADYLVSRGEEQPARISQALKAATGQLGDVHGQADELMASRAKAAAPLYEKAFAGGSLAPLESQFNDQFAQSVNAERAAQAKVAEAEHNLTNAMGKTNLSGPSAYSIAPAVENQGIQEKALAKAQSELANVQANKDAILTRLRQAQADGTANAPGAIWSPRVQQFIDDPIAKAGLRQGLEIQRLESLASGKPFNPTEFAVTGTDESGNPIVGSVPNMRTLDAIKGGIDNILEQYRDPTTGRLNLDRRGVAVDKVRQALISHLDELNPDYAAARAAWAGPSQAMDAMSMGRRALSNDPEVTAKVVKNLAPSDRDFFLNGVTRAIQDKIDGTPDGVNAVRRIFGNSAMRSKISAAFNDPQAFDAFAKQMEAEAQFAATKNAVLGNSATARRLAGMLSQQTDFTPHVVNLLQGNPGAAVRGAAATVGNALTAPSATQMGAQGSLLFTPNADAVAQAFRDAQPGMLRRGLSNALLGAKKGAQVAIPLSWQANQTR